MRTPMTPVVERDEEYWRRWLQQLSEDERAALKAALTGKRPVHRAFKTGKA